MHLEDHLSSPESAIVTLVLVLPLPEPWPSICTLQRALSNLEVHSTMPFKYFHNTIYLKWSPSTFMMTSIPSITTREERKQLGINSVAADSNIKNCSPFPKTTCFPSSQEVTTVVMKNYQQWTQISGNDVWIAITYLRTCALRMDQGEKTGIKICTNRTFPVKSYL